MHQLRANKASNLSANVLSKTKKMKKKIKRAYDIYSVLYFTVIKNTTASIKQDNKMSSKNDFVSKKFRIEIQIFKQQKQQQQQKTSAKKKEF